MGIHAVEKTIEGHRVSITTFGGVDGVTYKLRLLRLIGPSLVSMIPEGAFDIKKLSGSLLKAELSVDRLASAIENLLVSLDTETSVQFIQELVKLVVIDNKIHLSDRAAFDGFFAAEYSLLYKILYAVVEVNYGKLLAIGNIGEILKSVKQAQPILPKNTEK